MLGIRRHNRERALADALAASLEAIRGGTATAEDCLRRYPTLAADLEPLLKTSARLETMQVLGPSEQARLNARYALRQAAARPRPVPIAPRAVVRRRSWLALAPAAIAAVLFAAIAAPVMSGIDSAAVPGDWNYSFKRATERVRLAVATDPTDRRLLRIEFAKRRLNEIERLSSNGRVDSHAGEITALLKDYSSDVSQVKDAAQTQGAIPSAEKQQLEAVTTQAQNVIQPVAQSAPQDKPVKSAADQALTVSKDAAQTAASLPTPQSNKPASNQAPAPTKTPSPSVASALTVSPSPAPTETASPTPATPTSTSEPTASPTPPPTATSTSTPAPTSTPEPTPTTAPQALATRPAQVLTPVPTSAVTATVTPTQVLPADETATASPARTAAPGRTPTAGPPAASTPSRTPAPVSAAPVASTPVPTRAAAVESGLIVRAIQPEQIVYQWTEQPAPLNEVVAPLGNQVVFVTYLGANGQSLVWYPGTPAPVIGTNALLTVKLRPTATPVNGR